MTLKEINVSLERSSESYFVLIELEPYEFRLPNVPRPRMSICILADAADIDRAKQIELEYMSVDDLKKSVDIPNIHALCFLTLRIGLIKTKNS